MNSMIEGRSLKAVVALVAFVLITALAVLQGPTAASATGLVLDHFLATVGPLSFSLDGSYVPQPVLAGDTFADQVAWVSGAGPGFMLFFVNSLLSDQEIVLEEFNFATPTGCTFQYHGLTTLELSTGSSYHATIWVDPLDDDEFLFIGCSSAEILVFRNILVNNAVLVTFTLGH